MYIQYAYIYISIHNYVYMCNFTVRERNLLRDYRLAMIATIAACKTDP